MTEVQHGGAEFSDLLAVLFIGLQMTGNIDWPWVWVLSPLWIAFLFKVAVSVLSE